MKSDDIRILRDIEQYYSTQIDEMPMNSELPNLSLYVPCCMRCKLSYCLDICLPFSPVNDLI